MPLASAPLQRRPFAIATGIATVVGVAIAAAIASRAGLDSTVMGTTMGAIITSILAFGALCIIPIMGPPLVTDDRFGMAVFAISGVRTMLVLAAMMVLTEVMGLPKQPVVHGLLGGVLPIMFTEAFAAAWLINRRDAALQSIKAGATPAPRSA